MEGRPRPTAPKSIVISRQPKRLLHQRAYNLSGLIVTRYGDGSLLIEDRARKSLVFDANGARQLAEACRTRARTPYSEWKELTITPHPQRLNYSIGLVAPVFFSAPYRVARRWLVSLGPFELNAAQVRKLSTALSHEL